jgi:CYTH domain-containing protein
MPIPTDRFRSLWRLTKDRRIEITRYEIPFRGLTIEMDVYHGKLRPLMTAEVEFNSERQLRNFEPPPWFEKEVTGQMKFGNAQLALHGNPLKGK